MNTEVTREDQIAKIVVDHTAKNTARLTIAAEARVIRRQRRDEESTHCANMKLVVPDW